MEHSEKADDGPRDWLEYALDNARNGSEPPQIPPEEIGTVIRELCSRQLALETRNERLEAALRQTAQPSGQEEIQSRREERLYENLFTANHAVMLLINPASGEIVDANPAACRFYGYPRHNFIGRHISDINRADPGTINRMMRDVAAGKRHRMAFRHRLADGGIREVEACSGPLKEGERTLLFSIIHDISDRKRTERELEEARIRAEDASRAKSEFLAHMSHEIRTPMTVVLSALEQLRAADRPEARNRLLEMAKTSATTLLQLIDDILDVSRIEARKVVIDSEPFQLRELLRSTIEMFQPQASAKGLSLALDVAENVPKLLEGDPHRIRQVLINLLGNAIKFTERGEVRVTALRSPDGPGVCLSVIDSGIGMPAKALEGLFEAFSQVNSSRTRKYGGTGLGLAICRGLVELMGGEITVESEERRGSAFRVVLPLPEARKRYSDAERPPAQSETPPAAPARILLAEDDPMLRILIEQLLLNRQWEVLTAEDGEKALAIWQSQPVDLVLMDLQMPRMDGLTVTRNIRQREVDGRHTPIIALTAYAREEDRADCLREGMDDYAPKPIDRDALYRTIERLLPRA